MCFLQKFGCKEVYFVRRWWIVILCAVLAALLCGCMMKTVDEMYRLPKRSEDASNLQKVIDESMTGLSYCAPILGENQQTVQMADLNGDGVQEALVFAKGTGERPLKILVFFKRGEVYENTVVMEASGTDFEQVEYVDMDSNPGVEVVVGRKAGNEVLHSLSVYGFGGEAPATMLTAGYTRFLTLDLDRDLRRELVILRPGGDESNGVAELYDYSEDLIERVGEAPMSVPAERLKRIASGGMCSNYQAVFAASLYDEDTIITDVYIVEQGKFTNVALSNDSGTSVKTMRNYYVYGADIDHDGLIEIPSQMGSEDGQDILRWYNLMPTGEEVDKVYTYHNYPERWYVHLKKEWAEQIRVSQGKPLGSTQGYVFSLTDDVELFTIYALTGEERQKLEQNSDMFVLKQTDEVVYAAVLGPGAEAEGLDQQTLISNFNFIHEDWKTGET